MLFQDKVYLCPCTAGFRCPPPLAKKPILRHQIKQTAASTSVNLEGSLRADCNVVFPCDWSTTNIYNGKLWVLPAEVDRDGLFGYNTAGQSKVGLPLPTNTLSVLPLFLYLKGTNTQHTLSVLSLIVYLKDTYTHTNTHTHTHTLYELSLFLYVKDTDTHTGCALSVLPLLPVGVLSTVR